MDWAGVGTVHGSQTLHAFSALVSFGSDDLNVLLPQRPNSQFASFLHGL